LSPSPSTRSVVFTEVAATSQARGDSGEMLIVGTTDASRATISQLVPNATAPSGRVLVAAFQGQRNTGGYSIAITAIERNGDQLVVRATFVVPDPGAMVTQALTSPAHVVSIAAADVTGLREAILVDSAGTLHVRINTT
jgi:PrcB C-terminal